MTAGTGGREREAEAAAGEGGPRQRPAEESGSKNGDARCEATCGRASPGGVLIEFHLTVWSVWGTIWGLSMEANSEAGVDEASGEELDPRTGHNMTS